MNPRYTEMNDTNKIVFELPSPPDDISLIPDPLWLSLLTFRSIWIPDRKELFIEENLKKMEN